ncbi:MAG: hypothetical protein ACREO9_05275, partial [Lysobacterales bacterium]
MTDQNKDQAQLSVVVITLGTFASISHLMRYLEAQTAKALIEIVIVCPSEDQLALDTGRMPGFAGYKVVAIGPFIALHAPRVAAVFHASAPVIAYTEDHCFPAPGWARALIDAHKGPWAAVGPIIGLANPQTYMAWTSYFMQYGDWVVNNALSGHESRDIAGHNSSYKRDLLLAYGDELKAIMLFDTALHQDLQDRGHKLYVEPAARAYHVFITRLAPFCREHYYIGRLLAATRAQRWPRRRSVIYTLGSPLIPLVRLYRILRLMRRHGWAGELLPGALPSLLLGL